VNLSEHRGAILGQIAWGQSTGDNLSIYGSGNVSDLRHFDMPISSVPGTLGA